MISTHDSRMESARYARMGVQECEKIHMATLEILERTGVDVHDEAARKLLVAGGARADGIRVRIPEFSNIRSGNDRCLDRRTAGARSRPDFPGPPSPPGVAGGGNHALTE